LRICAKIVLLLTIYTVIVWGDVWNSPYPEREREENTLFSVFSSPPKHLDPVISYNANEWSILGQIYEPPLQYNYLKRPYTLEPLTLTSMPRVDYLDKNGKICDVNDTNISFTRYRLHLRDDIFYQEHPAFVKKKDGSLLYGALSEKELDTIERIDDFPHTATRRLHADDYVYAIKRMAVREYHSPILDIMLPYIVGLDTFSKKISGIAVQKHRRHQKLDLRQYHIEGVRAVDTQTLDILIHGKYPQGTGAYYLAHNDPNHRIVLKRNPHFHTEYYPVLSEEEARRSQVPPSLSEESGKALPFIDKVVFTLEKESIPLWNKFLQGYYDASGISAEAFDQAVQIGSSGDMGLSPAMREKGIHLLSAVQPSIFYMAFNMADPVVGGYGERARKLRQAISIAQNQEEYISIFMNERGMPAQGPIPPGIFGYKEGREGTNPYVYEWKNGKRIRKSIETARRLLSEAGYPGGISVKTGKRLKLYYDTTATGPDDRALMDWRRKQFAKLGIELVVRATNYNRFQDKVRKGKVQLFSWGWNADYPDPENFLFLLYGGNAAIDTNGTGINSSNYKNPEFDRLFNEIKSMDNTPERLEKIEKMLAIVRRDAPWVWGVYPKSLTLLHGWFKNVSPNAMANNTLKYKRIDAAERIQKQQLWNQPAHSPLVFMAAGVLLAGILLMKIYRSRENRRCIPKEEGIC